MELTFYQAIGAIFGIIVAVSTIIFATGKMVGSLRSRIDSIEKEVRGHGDSLNGLVKDVSEVKGFLAAFGMAQNKPSMPTSQILNEQKTK